ncbi:class I SAM-dependent methyltransferase [Xanthomonas euvesicatoria pv. eucalypti]|uniref:class I SAM-dependent methyltransferase n=1 Tax=Lysobacteraceae TaxID=32033 RepID=UPI0013D9B1B2|nr:MULTISPECIES: class I SAM-dependent methyltransferase [Xanthomonadaceae]MDO7931537.1 class I SAM-dependent methyltransferase [Xanthomonas euvesicatoria pv. eucalypti]MDO7935736.1 class I SAM-dependent methyltransferase [Xanthomonas euvesicatoria pv. eucalypti]MDO7940064.1 class I SAM-dependent methyltransferase [Xanthomonas euvesicatoria pv. eucalypti]MDO7944583.1 class I SAM-dependent methyltransferase [Xanthomonas euvesicatoria pv. eucalypti]MDO7951985.1 class I SAM-dependent methyltransf
MTKAKLLSQYMTPDWAASLCIERFLPDLGPQDLVFEPTCGRGAFLRAVPDHVPAIGMELDPELAAHAAITSGRTVVVGDVLTAPFPEGITTIVGNPPFRVRFFNQLLARAHKALPAHGRVGMLLPYFIFQTASNLEAIARDWSIEQTMLPRNLYPRLRHPLCFAVLTKDRQRRLIGFALFDELNAVNRLQRRYRQLLHEGTGSVWTAVVQASLEQLGGIATLADIYKEVEGHRPTTNQWWQAKVRQVLQRSFRRVGPGLWAIATPHPAAAAA